MQGPGHNEGITDAFRDGEACAAALGAVLRGGGDFDTVMADYQHTRDQTALPIYGLTTEFAALQPSPAEMQVLFAALQHARYSPPAGQALTSIAVTLAGRPVVRLARALGYPSVGVNDFAYARATATRREGQPGRPGVPMSDRLDVWLRCMSADGGPSRDRC